MLPIASPVNMDQVSGDKLVHHGVHRGFIRNDHLESRLGHRLSNPSPSSASYDSNTIAQATDSITRIGLMFAARTVIMMLVLLVHQVPAMLGKYVRAEFFSGYFSVINGNNCKIGRFAEMGEYGISVFSSNGDFFHVGYPMYGLHSFLFYKFKRSLWRY